MSQVFGFRRLVTAPLNLVRKYILPTAKELPDADKQKRHGGRFRTPTKCANEGHLYRFDSRCGPAGCKVGEFRCARCRKTKIFKIKNKHGDKINVRRSERPPSQGGTMLPVPERKAA